MRFFEKGEFSFVFLWIMNPLIILFYQNCAPSQLSQAETRGSDLQMSFASDNLVLPSRNLASASRAEQDCSGRHWACPRQ